MRNSTAPQSGISSRISNIAAGVVSNAIFALLLAALTALAAFLATTDIQTTLLITILALSLLIFLLAILIYRQIRGVESPNGFVHDEQNNLYFIDRFGLVHIIPNDDTALYLLLATNNLPGDIKQVPMSSLRKFGIPIPSMHDWRPPRSPQDEANLAVWSTLVFKKKEFANPTRLVFYFRNESEQTYLLESAQLHTDMGVPLLSTDVADAHEPLQGAFLNCRLLIDGKSVAKLIEARADITLELNLRRSLPAEDIPFILTRKLGMIKFIGTIGNNPLSVVKEC